LANLINNTPETFTNKSLSESSDIVGRADKCDDECRNTSVRSIHQESAGTSQNEIGSPRNKDSQSTVHLANGVYIICMKRALAGYEGAS
jgi:hypothetical protein